MDNTIYLDNAATTRPFEGAESIIKRHLENEWNNPSALYTAAVEQERRLKKDKETIMSAVRAENVIITSCGTESNNTVIFNGARRTGKPRHYITSAYEHACVYECFRELEQRGEKVTFVRPGPDGKISPADVAREVREDTALVSIMHVNNETGAVNDIDGIARAVKKVNPGTLFHSDGVQGFIKVPFDMKKSAVDYYTASAHKVHALKGTGALFLSSKSPLKPYILGGGQENGMRSGTENTLGISVFAGAVGDYLSNYDLYTSMIVKARQSFLESILDIPDTVVISPSDGAPHILSVSFPGVRGEVLLHSLSTRGIEISVGSACSSKKRKNRVHEALGLSGELAEGIVRISFSHFNTAEETAEAGGIIREEVLKLRRFRRL